MTTTTDPAGPSTETTSTVDDLVTRIVEWGKAYADTMAETTGQELQRLVFERGPKEVNEMGRMLYRHPNVLSSQDFKRFANFAGSQYFPVVLFDAWSFGKITRETLQAELGPAWSGAHYPDRLLPRREWRHLFATAGFTVDGVPAEHPEQPLELFRGSVPVRRRDWSWTTDRAMADKYATGGIQGRPRGRVYRVVAPPSALLCANFDRKESEYVVDTRGLRITEA